MTIKISALTAEELEDITNRVLDGGFKCDDDLDLAAEVAAIVNRFADTHGLEPLQQMADRCGVDIDGCSDIRAACRILCAKPKPPVDHATLDKCKKCGGNLRTHKAGWKCEKCGLAVTAIRRM